MAKNYYEILGVEKGAGDDEIKKAYRKLAHQHHPDKKGGDEAKFKEINEAYQVLSDKQKRGQYDQFGSTFDGANPGQGAGGFGGFDFSGFGGGNGANGFNFEGDLGDLFGDIFGGGGRTSQARQEKGKDVAVDIELTLEEALEGVEKEIKLYLSVVCSKCSGTGAETGSKMEKCKTCSGAGYVQKQKRTMFGVFAQNEICPDCKGLGERPEKRCSKCGGDGRVKEEKVINVKVPAGIAEGQTIRISGAGEAGFRSGSGKSIAGDLYVTAHLKKHPLFERRGDDLVYKLDISFSQAALGDSTTIPTLKGKIKLKIPSGIQSGKIIKIGGGGFPHLQGRGAGDMYLTVQIKTPEKISRKQRSLLEELQKEGL
ncbi:MAG: molecular chaperone DnaJ [Candidatus Paceibacterota bacterium]